MDIEPLSVRQFHAEATLLRMPGLAMMAGRRSASVYHRRREFIDHDDVGFTWGLTSSYQAHQFGRTVDLARGQAIVLTGAEPAFLRVPKLGHYINLRVPVRCLSPLVADLDAAYGRPIPAESPALQLLTRYVGILEQAGTFAVPELRRQAVIHIHDLIALAIGAARDAAEIAKSRGARAARLCAIKEDIATRLDLPDLSVATIAARHRIKPRGSSGCSKARARPSLSMCSRSALPRVPAADGSPLCQPKGQHYSARCRVRGCVLF